MRSLASRYSLILILASQATTAWADTLRVAVATNFSRTATLLAEQFEQQTGHTIRLAFGSTGKHFAQISHGAPFDLFLAADDERPTLLETNKIAVPGSRFTYAQGRLLLWSPDAGLIDTDAAVLETGTFRRLAIANPRLAPYGRAAREVLQARGLWERLQPRLVRGENIGQSYQFVHSGNAQLGFVAAAQVFASSPPGGGSYWEPPPSLYTPIIQQAVLIRDTPLARAFIDFLHSEAAREIIRRHGYHTPEVDTAVRAE